MLRFVSCLGLSASLLAIGCGGPTVGDIAGDEVVVNVSGITTAPKVAAIGDSQGGLGVSRAFVSASALTLLSCSTNVDQIVLDPRGYDTLTTPPPSERITTAADELCAIVLDIAPVKANATDGVPKGASLYVEAVDADGNALAFSSEASTSLLFRTADGSSIGDQPLLLGFDLSVWLAGLPLPDDMADTAASLFDSQLLDSAALYVDANGNHALDDDEQTPVAQASVAR